jgi:hypothetical protein
MANRPETEKTIWVICASCGHQYRNHRILHEKIRTQYEDPFGGAPINVEYHRFVECMGCESLKYVESNRDPQELDPYGGGEMNFKVYPDAPGTPRQRRASINIDEAHDSTGKTLVPDVVWKMYNETLDAHNHGIKTLAAGGLRATVEAICLHNGITNGNLQNKIDELATRNLLTAAQADLFHEERYLGNAALHELETPSSQAIEDGISIVEGLITTIYILPEKAARLRRRRQPPTT